jgi:hypothetical protein
MAQGGLLFGIDQRNNHIAIFQFGFSTWDNHIVLAQDCDEVAFLRKVDISKGATSGRRTSV